MEKNAYENGKQLKKENGEKSIKTGKNAEKCGEIKKNVNELQKLKRKWRNNQKQMKE